MPELPEVESLARYLGEQSVDRRVARVDVAAFHALKTFDAPADALVGRTVTGTDRRGKFLVVTAEPLHLVLHLARGGWMKWHDVLPAARPRPGAKGPLAFRVALDDGSGFDVTEAGTE